MFEGSTGVGGAGSGRNGWHGAIVEGVAPTCLVESQGFVFGSLVIELMGARSTISQ